MPTIPQSNDNASDSAKNINPHSGYPEGYVSAMNKSYVAESNLDGEIKSRREQTNQTIKYGIPRTVLGALTEVGAALPGVSDEEATAFVGNFTPDNIYQDFLDHKEGSQTAGALGVSLIPILGVTKIMRAEKTFKFVESLFGSRAAGVLLPSRMSMMDRVAKFKEEATLLAGKQQIAFTAEAAPVLAKMKKNMILSEALDTLKIGLGTDAGIYTMLNESDFFFPEEMSTMEMAAFYGVPNIVVSGISGAFMRYQLKNVLRDVGPIAREKRNVADLPLDEIIATPGNRHSYVTVLSAQRNIKKQEFKEAVGDSVLETNLNSQIQELDANITKQIELLASDNVVPGISKKWELDKSSLNTVRAALDKDFSALREAFSIENYQARSVQDLLGSIKSKKTELENKAKELFTQIGKIEDKNSPKYKKLLNELSTTVEQKEFMEGLTPVKINVDGSMQLASNSKTTYDDLITGVVKKNSNQDKITTVMNKAKEGDIIKTVDKETNSTFYTVKLKTQTGSQQITATNNLRLILPTTSTTKIKGVNFVEEVDLKNIDAIIERQKPVANIAEQFHIGTGKLGQRIFERLPARQQNALLDWGHDAASSKLRLWGNNRSDEFEELYNAFKPLRDKLKTVADADGTITLFRGEARGEGVSHTMNNVVPMTMNKELALKYAREADGIVISKKVSVDDIVAVVGGRDEFIVQNNAVRNAGEFISNAKYSELDFKGKTAAQVAIRKAVNEFTLEGISSPVFFPKPGLHHTELDAMLEVADKYGRNNPSLQSAFKFTPDGIKTFEDLEFASLKSKYESFVHQMDQIGMQKLSKIKLSDDKLLKVEDIIRTLNLPNDGITGMHPVAQLFMDAYLTRTARLDDVYQTLDAFKRDLIKSVTPRSDIAEKFLKADNISLRGTAYKTFEDERSPVFMLLKSKYENPLHREELISQVVGERLAFLDGLKQGRDAGAPLVSELTDVAMRDVDRWNTARKVDTLVEGSQKGTDRFTQTMFGVDNQPAVIAVDAIRNEQDNVWRSYVAKKFEAYNPVFNKLLSHDNTGDLTSFNIFVNQQGLGWRGTPKFVPVEEGGKVIGYKIPLEDHPWNKEMLKKVYNMDEIPEEVFMPAPKLKKTDVYEPLVISPIAAEAVKGMNEISQDVLKHYNYLRRLSGRPPIPAKPLHVPAKNLAGKELVYLIDKNSGQLMTVKSGNTPVQAKQLAEEEIRIAKENGVDLFMATENELENFNMVKLQAFTQMTDFSSPFYQTGAARGTSFGQTIETGPEVMRRMQEALINQYATISKVSSAMIFQPEFKMAEMASRTSGIQASTLKKGRSIWNVWMNRALGNRSSNRHQTIGKFYGAVEDIYDQTLQKIWDQKVSVFKGGQTLRQAESQFEALDKAVPGYNPFKDSVEFLQNTMKIKPPHNMVQHMSKLNNLVGLTMLRMFEIGLGLINVGTLPTLIPPVAKALQRQKGQTLEEWKALNSAWSSQIGDDVAIWNPYRAFTSGMHFFFSDEWRKVMPKAAEKGHLWQKTVEQLQLFTAPAQGYTEKMVKHYAELSSLFVDKTEELSRSISYATFYNMGRRNLKLGEDAAMDFAHHMANRVIGDFRPNVRPQMFQGATGMPFSLFTTFAWNYLQRVFGYLEKGQYKAFMNQMGLQTFFFGAKSLPGFNQYVEVFTDNYDGSENMVDRLQASFGTEKTDWFLYGSVGTLTGLATYTRADIVLPGSNFKYAETPLDFAPATSMIKQTYNWVNDSIKSIAANEGLNSRQLSEIASRSFPIRAMRGWFEVANGMSVDSRGQMLDNNVHNALDIFSRLSSIKTIRNQAVVEEFARQRSTQLRQNDIRGQMRLALRSAFRSGDLDGEFLNKMAEEYLRSGGEPGGFKSFVRRQALEGLVDKAYLRALELADKESQQKDYIRMMEIISQDMEE